MTPAMATNKPAGIPLANSGLVAIVLVRLLRAATQQMANAPDARISLHSEGSLRTGNRTIAAP